MQIDNMMQALKVLIRVDSLIAEIQFRLRLTQVGLMGAAILVAVFAVVMLGVAGYQYLKDLWGPVLAALAVAGASFVLAVIMASAAALKAPGKELQMAKELHNTALETLLGEARSATGDLSMVSRVLQGRFDTSLLALIGPVATLLLRYLRKASSQKAKEKSDS